jgi:hypothetical protein
LCQSGEIYVDPSGFVIADGHKIDGCEKAPSDAPTEIMMIDWIAYKRNPHGTWERA